MSGDTRKFIGLTKGQYVAVCLALVMVLSGFNAYLITRNSQLALSGAESHAVLCVLKRDYAKRREDSALFLAMTPAQREKKFGKALGAIPDTVLKNSIRNLDANIKAMKHLDCP